METTEKCHGSAQFPGIGYYRRFIKGFLMTEGPMTRFLQKNVRFEWSEKCQASFEKLKAFLTEVPVLTQSTYDK